MTLKLTAAQIVNSLLEGDDVKDWLMGEDYAAPDLSTTRFYIDVQPEDNDPDWDVPDQEQHPEDYEAHMDMLQNIARRLHQGDYWAYGIVTVYALWQHPFTREVFKGYDNLGGCSYDGPRDFCTTGGYFPQMAQEAYDGMLASYQHNDPDLMLEEPVQPGATEVPGEVVKQAELREPS